jgi:hypothetical protein
MRSRHRKSLFVFTLLVAVSAYGGAVGLASGTLDLGHELNQRLPLHSPVFAAIALALIVEAPSSVVARWVRRRDLRARSGLTVAGVLLIGWIGVELAFIRELAFLQFFYVCVGVIYVVLGRAPSPRVDVGSSPAGARSG